MITLLKEAAMNSVLPNSNVVMYVLCLVTQMSRNIRTWFAEANAADCVDRDSTLAKNHVTRSVNFVRKR